MNMKCKRCGTEFDPMAELMLFGKTCFVVCYPCVFLIPENAKTVDSDLDTGSDEAASQSDKQV